ncbi:MAG TPA: archease, partial [Candidatus Micrarchaeota archaeon]|nr:archease [Candidatus Micrarchaeota archaeon]
GFLGVLLGGYVFDAYGSSFAGAIESCAYAMFDFLGQSDSAGKSIEIEESAARNREELVVFTLAKIVSNIDAEEMAPHSFEVTELDEKTLRLTGTLKLGKGRVKDHIKAVTFGNMEIEHKERGKWRIRVLLDI